VTEHWDADAYYYLWLIPGASPSDPCTPEWRDAVDAREVDLEAEGLTGWSQPPEAFVHRIPGAAGWRVSLAWTGARVSLSDAGGSQGTPEEAIQAAVQTLRQRGEEAVTKRVLQDMGYYGMSPKYRGSAE
jgi:hypothetical protein